VGIIPTNPHQYSGTKQGLRVGGNANAEETAARVLRDLRVEVPSLIKVKTRFQGLNSEFLEQNNKIEE
jgi:hypothetical protein